MPFAVVVVRRSRKSPQRGDDGQRLGGTTGAGQHAGKADTVVHVIGKETE